MTPVADFVVQQTRGRGVGRSHGPAGGAIQVREAAEATVHTPERVSIAASGVSQRLTEYAERVPACC